MSASSFGLFLDTSNVAEIEKYHEMGIIRGVTTNPTIMLKEGLTGGWTGIRKRAEEIAALIKPYPVSIEVVSNDYRDMKEQALEFAGWAKNVNVKITIHGPNGELDNLKLVHELETEHNVRVNVTAIMSAQQAILAAQAGASYVSLFCGRVNNMGYDSRQEVRRLRGLLDSFSSSAKIIAASTREILNVVEWFESGAHIVTVTPNLIGGMIVHPYSKETVKMFLDDGAKLRQETKPSRKPAQSLS